MQLKKELLKTWVTNPQVIFDIGCYDGKDSIEFSQVFPDSLVYSFECDRRSAQLFRESVTCERITLVETAVGNIDGEVSFNPSDSDTRRHGNEDFWSSSGSLKKPKKHLELFDDIYFKSSEIVPCTRLDTWTQSNNIYPDIIWADVNGAEREFIEGAKETLKHNKVLVIEFEEKELFEGALNKDQICKLLPEYELRGVYNFKGNYGNILSVKRGVSL